MKYTISEYPQLEFGSVYCIGRNYAKHVAEMGSEKTEDPVVFLKPRSSLIFDNQAIELPEQSVNVHHEVELVLLINRESKNLSVKEASQSVQAIAVGIDVTARDIQSKAKKEGLPWTLSKGFHTFAPVGNFVDIQSVKDLRNLDIQVKVNNQLRQAGNTSQMLFSPAEIISYLSHHFKLTPGDLIFTGTPAGVSPIQGGDIIEASLGDQLSTLKVYVRS